MTDASRQTPPSLGRPRLIFSAGGEVTDHEPQREFDLVDHITTIGSASDADLCLPGLEHRHAEIRHDDADDYVYFPLGALSGSSVHGRPGVSVALRTGARPVPPRARPPA